MTTAQDQQSRALWIDPNDKSRAQYLPHIGEAVLFKHAGRVYTGKHTGGSFKADYPLGKSFTTWDCVWMYPSELDTAAQVLAMGRIPPGWQAVPLEMSMNQLLRVARCWPLDVPYLHRLYADLLSTASRPLTAGELAAALDHPPPAQALPG